MSTRQVGICSPVRSAIGTYGGSRNSSLSILIFEGGAIAHGHPIVAFDTLASPFS